MKRITFALGLAVATAMAAPLSAQSRNDGPWWDPANTGTRSGSTARTDTRDGRINNDGRIYDSRRDSRRVDGRWRAEGRDRRGNVIYVRTRYDNNRNVILERATRDRRGQYRVIDRRVVQYANDRRNDDRRGQAGRRNDGARNGAPAFCRSGEGHPVFGRRWCIDKGHGLGSDDDRRGRGRGKGRR